MARKGGPSQVGQNSGAPPAGAGSAPSGPMTGMRRRRNVARSGVNASQGKECICKYLALECKNCF